MKFQIGKNNIVYLGDNFKTWFGGVEFEEEKTKPLHSMKLPRAMNDKEILSELKPTEVTLEEVYETLKNMDKKIWAIFYVRDKNDVLRTVSVYWYGGGWCVGAGSTDDTNEWSGGRQVFSRNSFDEDIKKLVEKEFVICAAIRMKDGYIIRGHRHSDAIATMKGIPRYKDEWAFGEDQGFVTSKNRYVTRKEGYEIQKAAGIESHDKENPYVERELYSEDLY